MKAALLRRQVRTWRSRQLALTLSLPPTNHFASGGFHSSTLLQRLDPLELLREAGPERLRILRRPGVDAGIVEERLGNEVDGRSEAAIFFSRASISGDTGSDMTGVYGYACQYHRNRFGRTRIRSSAEAADEIIAASMRSGGAAAASCSARSHSRLTRRGKPPDSA